MPSPYLSRKHPDLLARASWHDYTGRSIYLVTFNVANGIPPFSSIEATDQNGTAVCHLSNIGETIEHQISHITDFYPFVSVISHCVMPDHIHLLVFVKEKTKISLGQIIGSLKGNCSKAAMTAFPELAQKIKDTGLFSKGFNDRILQRNGQLDNFRRYIEDNPRRYLIRKSHPEYFNRVNMVAINGQEYAFYGNFLLLRHCVISAVRISRSFSPAELQAKHSEWNEVARSGGVLVSPFISVAERIVRDKACENGAKIIHLVTNGLPERYKPSGREFVLCAQGRLLIIAPVHHNTRKENLTRAQCLRLTELAELIAAQGARMALRNP